MTYARAVDPPFDYSVTISPSAQTIEVGEETSFALEVSLLDGEAETVTLGLAGLPDGVHYSFSVISGLAPYSSTLIVDTSTSRSMGAYTITVTASGGGKTKTATVPLIITEVPDFSISVSPLEASILQGEFTSYALTIEKIGGFDQPVLLAASGLPSGVTPRFSRASGEPYFTSMLTLDTTKATPPGSYAIAVDAAGGGKIHSVTITMTVREKSQETPSSISATATSQEVPETTGRGSDIAAFLANPLHLLIIIVALLAATLIVAVGRQGRTPTPQQPGTPTAYCMNCGARLVSGAFFCPWCGNRSK